MSNAERNSSAQTNILARANGIDVVTLYERMVPLKCIPYPITWIVIGAAIFGLGIAYQRYFGEVNYLWTQITLIVVFSGMPIGTIHASHLMEDLVVPLRAFVEMEQNEIDDWYLQNLQFMFFSKTMWAVAISVNILGSLTILWLGIPLKTAGGKILAFIFIQFLFFFCGLSLHLFVSMLIFIHRLSKLPIRIPLYQHPLTSIAALGPLYFKGSVAVLFFYLLILLAIWFGPYGLPPLMLVWVAVLGVTPILLFLYSQIGIHNIMVKSKHDRLRGFSPKLEKAFETAMSNPTPDNINYLKEMLDLQERLEKMKGWPFDYRLALTLFTTAVLPLLLLIADVLFRR